MRRTRRTIWVLLIVGYFVFWMQSVLIHMPNVDTDQLINNAKKNLSFWIKSDASFVKNKNMRSALSRKDESGSVEHLSPQVHSKLEISVRAREFNVRPMDISDGSNFIETRNDFYNSCTLKAMQPEKVTLEGSDDRQMPFWQRKLKHCGKLGHVSHNGTWGYFIAELLQVRLYDEDLAKWTIKELKQWLHFMFLAGTERVFLCDHYKNETERLDIPLRKYIDLGLVTYINWSSIRNAMEAQVKCYEHIIQKYKHMIMWSIAFDMDEYPVSFRDRTEGFLTRYVREVMVSHGQRLSEVSIENFLMLGEGDQNEDIVSSRINRVTKEQFKNMVKPIFRAERVEAGIHRNVVRFGKTFNESPLRFNMFHYWGKRLQDWGPDSESVLKMTRKFNFMKNNWDEQIRNSLLVFGETDAFSAKSGP